MAVELTRENGAMHGAALAGELASAVRRIGGVIPRRANNPLLFYVRIQAADDRFRLTATDLETWVEVTMPGKVIGRGVTLTPYRALKQVLQGRPKGEVRIYADRGMVLVESQHRVLGLPTAEPVDYPLPPEWPAAEDLPAEVNIGRFRFALQRAVIAASRDRAWPILMSVRLRAHSGTLTATATDAYRISHSVLEAAVEDPIEAVLSSQAVDALLRLMPSDGVARFGVSDGMFFLAGTDPRGGRFRFASRLVEGMYPEIDPMLHGPEDDWAVWAFDRDELAGAVRSVARLGAPVVFDLGPGKAQVIASAPDLGSVEVELHPQRVGRPIKIGFNPKLVADVLPYFLGVTVIVACEGPLHRSIWRDPADPSFTYVAMPMRLAPPDLP